MTKAKSNALCAGIIAVGVVHALIRHDVAFAAPMLLIAAYFARWAHRDRKRAA